MIYLKLFWSFFQIGLFSFGGGYAALPLIQNQMVEINAWLSMSQFADIITIAEMTPGPIAINAATFAGLKLAGFWGAVISTVGCILPSCVIVLILAFIYFKYKELKMVRGVLAGLRPVVVALITSAALSILSLSLFGSTGYPLNIRSINLVSVGIFSVGIIVLRRFKTNPIFVLAGAGFAGFILYQYLV